MKIIHAAVLVATGLMIGGCNHDQYYYSHRLHQGYGNDEGEKYLQRKDTVTLSAGDAKEVNARTHMLAAWPPGVGDRRIAMSGPRAVRAVECYYNPQSRQQGNGGGAGGSPVSLNLNVQTGGTQSGQQQQKNC